MASNIITPPDYLANDSLKVLLFDIGIRELVEAHSLLSGIDFDVDLYIYGEHSNDVEWIELVLPKMDSVLIVLDNKNHMELKERLLELKKTVYVGIGESETTAKNVGSVTEHLAQVINERKISFAR